MSRPQAQELRPLRETGGNWTSRIWQACMQGTSTLMLGGGSPGFHGLYHGIRPQSHQPSSSDTSEAVMEQRRKSSVETDVEEPEPSTSYKFKSPLFDSGRTPPLEPAAPLAVPSNLEAPCLQVVRETPSTKGKVVDRIGRATSDGPGHDKTAEARERSFTMPSVMDDYFPPAPPKNHSLDPDKAVLSLQNSGLEDIPRHYASSHGQHTIDLDLRGNNISLSSNLILFNFLQVLNLSANKIKVVRIPRIRSLVSLDISKNQIEDLDVSLFDLAHALPNLANLNTLENPGHPIGISEDAVLRYRDGAVSKFKSLTELDNEKLERNRRNSASFISRVARPDPREYTKKANNQKLAPISRRRAPTVSGFIGEAQNSAPNRESQGNRFIRNDDL